MYLLAAGATYTEHLKCPGRGATILHFLGQLFVGCLRLNPALPNFPSLWFAVLCWRWRGLLLVDDRGVAAATCSRQEWWHL